MSDFSQDNDVNGAWPSAGRTAADGPQPGHGAPPAHEQPSSAPQYSQYPAQAAPQYASYPPQVPPSAPAPLGPQPMGDPGQPSQQPPAASLPGYGPGIYDQAPLAAPPRKRRRGLIVAVLVVVLALAAGAGGGAWWWTHRDHGQAAESVKDQWPDYRLGDASDSFRAQPTEEWSSPAEDYDISDDGKRMYVDTESSKDSNSLTLYSLEGGTPTEIWSGTEHCGNAVGMWGHDLLCGSTLINGDTGATSALDWVDDNYFFMGAAGDTAVVIDLGSSGKRGKAKGIRQDGTEVWSSTEDYSSGMVYTGAGVVRLEGISTRTTGPSTETSESTAVALDIATGAELVGGAKQVHVDLLDGGDIALSSLLLDSDSWDVAVLHKGETTPVDSWETGTLLLPTAPMSAASLKSAAQEADSSKDHVVARVVDGNGNLYTFTKEDGDLGLDGHRLEPAGIGTKGVFTPDTAFVAAKGALGVVVWEDPMGSPDLGIYDSATGEKLWSIDGGDYPIGVDSQTLLIPKRDDRGDLESVSLYRAA